MRYNISRFKRLILLLLSSSLAIYLVINVYMEPMPPISTFHLSILQKRNEPLCPGKLTGKTSTVKSVGPILHHTRYSFPINVKNACARDDVKLIIPIHSAVTNFKRRYMTRQNRQGKFAKDKRNKSLMLFFVGLPSESLSRATAIQTALKAESAIFHDIVQVNISETYHNVVYKAIAVLQWIEMYCPDSEFVLKLDDDVQIKPSRLLGLLCSLSANHTDFIVGMKLTGSKPYRKRDRKYFVSKDEYPNEFWPPYVTGGARAFPTSTSLMLYQQAIRTEIVWIEDVFIGGICPKKLGIPVLNNDMFSSIEMILEPEHFVY